MCQGWQHCDPSLSSQAPHTGVALAAEERTCSPGLTLKACSLAAPRPLAACSCMRLVLFAASSRPAIPAAPYSLGMRPCWQGYFPDWDLTTAKGFDGAEQRQDFVSLCLTHLYPPSRCWTVSWSVCEGVPPLQSSPGHPAHIPALWHIQLRCLIACHARMTAHQRLPAQLHNWIAFWSRSEQRERVLKY